MTKTLPARTDYSAPPVFATPMRPRRATTRVYTVEVPGEVEDSARDLTLKAIHELEHGEPAATFETFEAYLAWAEAQ